MELHCEVENGWDEAADWEELANAAIAAVSSIVKPLSNPRLSASLLFTDDAALKALNTEWRGKDKPTNVLSFPMLDSDQLEQLSSDGPPMLLGDIALSFDTCARESVEKSISIADHASHLIVHGMLHLAGFDHETGEAYAEEMERLEIKALAKMGIKDPYGHAY